MYWQKSAQHSCGVGTKYVAFGALLLDDSTGARVKNMAHKHLNDAEPINTEILQQWLNESGKQPVTWAALVEVLCDIELSVLAGEIKAVKCPASPCSHRRHTLVNSVLSCNIKVTLCCLVS